jgi:hypothetical protein
MVTLLLAVALANGGCRSEGNAGNANSATKQAGAPEQQSNNVSVPAGGEAARATPTDASPATTQTTTPAVVTDSLPVTDAVAFRDRLLELARSAAFAAEQSASNNGSAIREAWQKQYPGLKFTFFYSMPADPNTVSASDAFLTTGAAVSGNYDRLYAFAVADTKGKCAGGAAVIPGDTPTRKVSDDTVPTVFKPIEMSNARACTGDAAGENYRP